MYIAIEKQRLIIVKFEATVVLQYTQRVWTAEQSKGAPTLHIKLYCRSTASSF